MTMNYKFNFTDEKIDEIQLRYHHLRYGHEYGFTNELAREYLAGDLDLTEEEISYAIDIDMSERFSKFDI